MKRLIIVTIALTLMFSLVGCSNDSKLNSTPAPTSTELGENPQKIDKGDGDPIIDSDQGDPGDTEIPEWWGIFIGQEYNQEYFISITDVSEDGFWFEISNMGGENVIFSGNATLNLKDTYTATYDEETTFSFTLSSDGLGIYLEAEDDRLLGQYSIIDPNDRYALEGRGDYFPEEEGKGDIFNEGSDPGDTETPEWWGTFESDEYTMGIVNFNGNSFRFEVFLTSNGSIFCEGVAALYPDNPLMAEFGQLSLSLYEDFNTIDLFAPENHEYANLRGQYVRVE